MSRFDPFGLLERLVPAQRLHMTIRVAALMAVLGFLVLRVRQYHDFLFKPLGRDSLLKIFNNYKSACNVKLKLFV